MKSVEIPNSLKTKDLTNPLLKKISHTLSLALSLPDLPNPKP